jgi:hypothetical protein
MKMACFNGKSYQKISQMVFKVIILDYTVKNRLGNKHQNTDTMSRINADNIIRRIVQEANTLEKIEQTQYKDPEIWQKANIIIYMRKFKTSFIGDTIIKRQKKNVKISSPRKFKKNGLRREL